MILLTTASLPHYGLERVFSFARDTGFDGIEVCVDKRFDTQNPKYLKRLETHFGLPIRAFTLPLETPEKLLPAFQQTIREFPNTKMILRSPEIFAFEYKKWMQKVAPLISKKYNIQVMRMNNPLKFMLGFVPLYSQNSLTAISQNTITGLDTSALWTTKEDVLKAVNMLGKKLQYLHLSNVVNEIPYNTLEDGVIRIDMMLQNLSKKGFSGDIVIALDPSQLHEGEEERMLEILQKSVEYVRKHYKTGVETVIENEVITA